MPKKNIENYEAARGFIRIRIIRSTKGGPVAVAMFPGRKNRIIRRVLDPDDHRQAAQAMLDYVLSIPQVGFGFSDEYLGRLRTDLITAPNVTHIAD